MDKSFQLCLGGRHGPLAVGPQLINCCLPDIDTYCAYTGGGFVGVLC